MKVFLKRLGQYNYIVDSFVKEKSFYQGNNYVDMLEIYYPFASSDKANYLTAQFLRADGRKIGPIQATSSEELTNSELGANVKRVVFSMTTISGVLEVPGALQISVMMHHVNADGSNYGNQVVANVTNSVIKTSYTGEENNVIVVGENASRIISNMQATVDDLANKLAVADKIIHDGVTDISLE